MKKAIIIDKIGQGASFIWEHKFLALIVAAAVIGIFYYGYQKNNKISQAQTGTQTATVERGDIYVSVTGSGQVYVANQVDLQGVAAGDGIDVVQVEVKNDQEVKEGDLIAVLDTTEPAKKVRDAQLSLDSALISQRQTNRQYDNKTVEEKWQRQSQDIAVQQRQASLADAKSDLQDYYIRAPFDGIVTGLSVEVGDSVSRDDVLASVITRQMHVEISLNEVDAAKVEAGDKASITFDALPDLAASGSVSRIDTIGAVDQGVVSYNAQISFDNQSESLKPGMSASAEIMIESKQNVLMIPSSAVNSGNNGSEYVMVLDNSHASADSSEEGNGIPPVKRVSVETGITDGVNTEITSGFNEGDVVITQMATTDASSANGSQTTSRGGNSFFQLGGGGRNSR